MLEPQNARKINPLDGMMTRAQVVRRKFNASRPRTIQNRVLSKLEAMARTMELFDKLRSAMAAEGLNKEDVLAHLVFVQPQTPGLEDKVRTAFLPSPEKIGTFVDKIMALDNPVFLGVLFGQYDHETDKEDKKRVAFLWPFRADPKSERALLAARRGFVRGGNKALDN